MAGGKCSDDPAWAATPAAYTGANTDAQLQAWWASQPQPASFAPALGKSFGDQRTWFDCGIDREPSCTISGCDVFVKAEDPPWTYHALISVTNLNMYFNAIYDGVIAGQLGFTNTIPDIAQNFFPPKDQDFPFGNVAPWLIAVLTLLFAFPLMLGNAAALGGIGAGSLLIGATTTIDDQLAPPPGSNMFSVVQMQNHAAKYGETTRDMIANWANDTFQGHKDEANHDIIDYLKGGVFATSAGKIPSSQSIEAFYKTQMIARTINSKWKTSRVFIMFTQTLNEDDLSGPNQTKYYSREDAGVYYLYQMHEGSRSTSQLGKPEGLDKLNGTYFAISGPDVTKSSARAFRAARFNYTLEMQNQEVQNAMASNNTVDPFREPAAWLGTWTLPVCDTGKHNWNIQYDETGSRYGRLPCCCGTDCQDTKDFVKAANIHGSQAYLRGCYEQLKSVPDLDFESIDYGYQWENSFMTFWAWASDGIRAGLVIGMIVGGIVATVVLVCGCAALGSALCN